MASLKREFNGCRWPRGNGLSGLRNQDLFILRVLIGRHGWIGQDRGHVVRTIEAALRAGWLCFAGSKRVEQNCAAFHYAESATRAGVRVVSRLHRSRRRFAGGLRAWRLGSAMSFPRLQRVGSDFDGLGPVFSGAPQSSCRPEV